MPVFKNILASIGDVTGKISINGTTIQVGGKGNVQVTSEGVYVDGDKVHEMSSISNNITIKVYGSCGNIETGIGDVEADKVEGNVRTGSGDVTVSSGDVSSIQTGSGDVDVLGNVGSVRTGSGDINVR